MRRDRRRKWMISSFPMRRHNRHVVRNQETKRVQRSTSRIRARPRGTKRMRGRSHEKPSEQNSPNRVHGGRNSAIDDRLRQENRSEEHTSELQSLMRISYAVF